MITLNGIINNIQSRKHSRYAVVVDNIIVFSRIPSSNGSLRHWAHEVAHTIQFREFGIDRFARMYITHHSALEAQRRRSRQSGTAEVPGILATAPVEHIAVTQGAPSLERKSWLGVARSQGEH